MDIKFKRITPIRSVDPSVLATVGEYFVKWRPNRGWDCTCLSPEDEYECDHIEAVQDLLEPQVTTIAARKPRIGIVL